MNTQQKEIIQKRLNELKSRKFANCAFAFIWWGLLILTFWTIASVFIFGFAIYLNGRSRNELNREITTLELQVASR